MRSHNKGYCPGAYTSAVEYVYDVNPTSCDVMYLHFRLLKRVAHSSGGVVPGCPVALSDLTWPVVVPQCMLVVEVRGRWKPQELFIDTAL